MRIGELARRLRVSTRTLRHYEAIGLLLPADADDVSGYRSYGEAELLRGVRIEQLKATGLALADIVLLLGSTVEVGAVLAAQHRRLVAQQQKSAQQLRVLDALGLSAGGLAAVEQVEEPAVERCTVYGTARAGELTSVLRRQIQRMRRRVRADGATSPTFVARLPLDVAAETVSYELGHDAPDAPPIAMWPAATVLRVELVGPLSMLPLAYDAVLCAVEQRGLQPTGSVVETYLELGPVPRTALAVPVTGVAATG